MPSGVSSVKPPTDLGEPRGRHVKNMLGNIIQSF